MSEVEEAEDKDIQRAAIIDVDEANAGEDAGESVGEDEDEDEDEDEYQDVGEYACEDEEGGEDEDFVEHIIEDELEDEAKKDENTMTYLSIWKAMVNNKEVLCSKSRLFMADLTIYSIQRWQRKVLEHVAPWQLETQQLIQNLYGNGSNSPAVPSPYPPPYAPPVPSSPIRSSSDLSEVLIQFFDWLITKSNTQQMEILDNIKNKLLDKDWNLDTLRDEQKGRAMMTAIWESYGFKLGTLANIQSKLSEFKQQRRPQSHDSAGNNSS
ncbi:MAG: hypothetical protein M1840_002393 [Geoglossum simile]|nr:MAG: hypothetical protein M1840_002393 [Geoglossum simile]